MIFTEDEMDEMLYQLGLVLVEIDSTENGIVLESAIGKLERYANKLSGVDRLIEETLTPQKEDAE